MVCCLRVLHRMNLADPQLDPGMQCTLLICLSELQMARLLAEIFRAQAEDLIPSPWQRGAGLKSANGRQRSLWRAIMGRIPESARPGGGRPPGGLRKIGPGLRGEARRDGEEKHFAMSQDSDCLRQAIH